MIFSFVIVRRERCDLLRYGRCVSFTWRRFEFTRIRALSTFTRCRRPALTWRWLHCSLRGKNNVIASIFWEACNKFEGLRLAVLVILPKLFPLDFGVIDHNTNLFADCGNFFGDTPSKKVSIFSSTADFTQCWKLTVREG